MQDQLEWGILGVGLHLQPGLSSKQETPTQGRVAQGQQGGGVFPQHALLRHRRESRIVDRRDGGLRGEKE